VTSTGTEAVSVTLSTGSKSGAIPADAILFKPTGLDVARTTYEWDHQNRLTKVTNESAAFSATGVMTLSPRDTTTYAYDVLGRRAAVTYDLVGPADGGGDFRRVSVYDGSQVVWTETGTNREQMVSQGTTQAMLWAPGTDQLLAIQERLGGSGLIKQPVWTLTDHQGTVKDYLAKAPTAGAESGLLLTRQYSTFGTPLSAKQWVNVPTGGTSFTDINGKSGFFYVGQEYDASTGLQYSRARYYDPVSSEFISQDPLGFAGGDTNLYRRDGNQSVSARPRDRNWSEWAWESGAAAVSAIGNALKLAVDPRTQLSVGYDLFFKDSATVWGNTAGMSTASRLGITAGFFVGDLTGLRGVDDFFHTHDAADAHVQSRTEQWFDGVFGAIGVAGTIAGGGAVAKTVQTLGVKGTVAAGAAYARATVARVGTGARGLVDDVLRVGKNAVAPTQFAPAAIHPGRIAAESADASRASVMRVLRAADTPEANAVAKLLKRGRVDIEFLPTDPFGQGAWGRAPWGSKTVQVYLDKAGDSLNAAGIVAHETRHVLDKFTAQTYTLLHELRAYQFQRNAGFLSMTDDEILNFITTSELYRNVSRGGL
jgi:RHS repeat-associated protein